MIVRSDLILLLGESDVGKTHYGAQLLKRLMNGGGLLRMNGAATNLDPFESALERLNDGKSAGHTANATYVDSVWPVIDTEGQAAEIVWPDYGGEQLSQIVNARRMPNAWRTRVSASQAWLLLIRLQQMRAPDDIFSRPLASLSSSSSENREVHVSDQARFIELLQFLLFAAHAKTNAPLEQPRLCVLLTCWDELGFGGTPMDALQHRLPMFCEFVEANWRQPLVLGLSALGRPLSPSARDMDYVALGPENFGYVVKSDGSETRDLTLPIRLLLKGPKV